MKANGEGGKAKRRSGGAEMMDRLHSSLAAGDLDERQLLIVFLLAQLCAQHDPTPRSFVLQCIKFHELGVLSSLQFLVDLGLLPQSPSVSTLPGDPALLQALPSGTAAALSGDLVPRGPAVGGLRSLIESNIISFDQTDPLNINVSRYQREFEEVELLGRGAFGSVYKARHRLDGVFYAIKKVPFTHRGFTALWHRKVMREVRCLARLDHPNVCRYFTAWVEPTWLRHNPEDKPRAKHGDFAAEFESAGSSAGASHVGGGGGGGGEFLLNGRFAWDDVSLSDSFDGDKSGVGALEADVKCAFDFVHSSSGGCDSDLDTSAASGTSSPAIARLQRWTSASDTWEEQGEAESGARGSCYESAEHHASCNDAGVEDNARGGNVEKMKGDDEVSVDRGRSRAVSVSSAPCSPERGPSATAGATARAPDSPTIKALIAGLSISSSDSGDEGHPRDPLISVLLPVLPPSSPHASGVRMSSSASLMVSTESAVSPQVSPRSLLRSPVRVSSAATSPKSGVSVTSTFASSSQDDVDSPNKAKGLPAAAFRVSGSSAAPEVTPRSHTQLLPPGGGSQFRYAVTLFIQTNLCTGETLEGWLRTRTARCTRFRQTQRKLVDQQRLDGVNRSDQERTDPSATATGVETNAGLREVLQPAHCMELLRQAIEGLAHIHSHGVIHRDLKPGNLFVCEGDPGTIMIGDFGLSKISADDEAPSATATGAGVEVDDAFSAEHLSLLRRLSSESSNHTTGVGTLSYASPEQALGGGYGSSTDIYSLGLIAIELFTIFGTQMERAAAFARARLPKPCLPPEFKCSVPHIALVDVVKAMLSHVPSERPTALELLSALDAAMTSLGGDPRLAAVEAGVNTAESKMADPDPQNGVARLRAQLDERNATVRRQAAEIERLRAELAALQRASTT